MTEEIGKQITYLRHKGLGYKSIALVLDISRENVRYYCKKHELSGTGEQVRIRFENNKNPDTCKQCGKKFERHPRSGKKLFCSEQCRRAWWKEHPDQAKHGENAIYEIRCAYCNRIFYSYGNNGRKYCSHDCYILDRFWKDRKCIKGFDIKSNKRSMITIKPGKI